MRELDHVFDAGAHGVHVFHFAANHLRGEHIAERGILPARHEHRRLPFRRRHHPAIFRIDLVEPLQLAGEQHAIEKFVGEEALAGAVGRIPLLDDDALDAAHGFLFGNAGVGDAIEVAVEQILLFLRA